MNPMRRKPDPRAAESPLEVKKREIAETEAKTRKAIEQCKKVIAEAPLRAEKIARARREEVIARASHTTGRRENPAALHDRWRTLEVNTATPVRHQRLRSERRQGRRLFFLLLLALAGVAYWLYYTVLHS